MERAKWKKTVDQSQSIAVDKVLGNNDLLTKVLNLLPPKPLVRSKAVSSHWLALISDPLFLLTYTRHHRTIHLPSTLSQFYYNTIPISLHENVPKIDRLEGVRLNTPNSNNFVMLNSCNGLVLCKYHHIGRFYIFNPTTNKYRPLPQLCETVHENIVLAFDPLESFNYKVVSFKSLPFDHTHDLGHQECVIDIFSSKSGSWNEIRLPAPHVGLTKSGRVFWNGGIHWISDTNFHVRFDVNEENFTWNQIPIDANTFPEGDNIGYMGECDTGLLLIKFPQEGNFLAFGHKCKFTVLEMKKGSNCWVAKHHVNLELLLPQMGVFGIRVTVRFNLLYVLSGADQDCFSLVIGVHGKIILCSINNRNNHIATKVLKEFPQGYYFDFHYKFVSFIPCEAAGGIEWEF